jgi:hypothetical protein
MTTTRLPPNTGYVTHCGTSGMPPSKLGIMVSMDDPGHHNQLKSYAANWRLGNIPSEQLVQWAVDALVEGVDSPSLRELAALGRADDPRRASELFPQVLEELGELVPTEEEAAWLLMGARADEMIQGRITASKLNETVWFMYTRTNLRNDETIRAFIAAYSTLDRQRGQEDEQSATWALEQVAWVLRARSRQRI